MEFFAYGHENIRSTHRTTFEFTQDGSVTPKGDCIVGVRADYSLDDIRPLLLGGRIRITICVDGTCEVVEAEPNPDFCDEHEMVVRTSDFVSGRTLGIGATKAACDFCFKNKLAKKDACIRVKIEECGEKRG
jgi:hypothetical protein